MTIDDRLSEVNTEYIRKEKTKADYLKEAAEKQRRQYIHYDTHDNHCGYNECGMTCHFVLKPETCPRYER